MEKSDIHQNNEVDEGVERARRIAQEAEFGSRRLSGVEKYIVPCVAAAWSLFQFSLPEILFWIRSMFDPSIWALLSCWSI